MDSKHHEEPRGRIDNSPQPKLAPQNETFKLNAPVRPSTSVSRAQRGLVGSRSYQDIKTRPRIQIKTPEFEEPHSLESLANANKFENENTTPEDTHRRNDSKILKQKSYNQSPQKRSDDPENKMYKITLGDYLAGEEATIELFIPKKVKVMKFTDYRTYCKSLGRVKPSARQSEANDILDMDQGTQSINHKGTNSPERSKAKESGQLGPTAQIQYTEYFPGCTVSKSLNLDRRAKLHRTRQQQMFTELQKIQPLRSEENARLFKMPSNIPEFDPRGNNFILPSVKSNFTEQMVLKAHQEYNRFRQSLKDLNKQLQQQLPTRTLPSNNSKMDSQALIQKIKAEENWNRAKSQQNLSMHRGTSSVPISGSGTPPSFIVRNPSGAQRDFKDYSKEIDSRVLKSSMVNIADEEKTPASDVQGKFGVKYSEKKIQFNPLRSASRKTNGVSVDVYLKELSSQKESRSVSVEKAQA